MLNCNGCILSILVQCLPSSLLSVWFLPQSGQLAQILCMNFSTAMINDPTDLLCESVCSSMHVHVFVCVCECETFVRAHQCAEPLCACIYTRICCVMKPSPVLSHLSNYSAMVSCWPLGTLHRLNSVLSLVYKTTAGQT